jgi:ParB family chromosome partitioning protein
VVREAKGESSAQLIDHLKKADMAKEAERLLDGSGWLPEPLRLVDPSVSSVEQEGEMGPLPEFLADDEDRENAGDDDPQQLDAAE